MARIKLNPIVEEVHGQLGDLVFREVNGQTILSRKPSINGGEPTQEQAEQRERFRQAAAYGRFALADNNTRQVYEDASEQKRIPVFALTVADFLNAPSITDIDLSAYNGQVGDPIRIVTQDDFGVVNVQVQIMDGQGDVIESGSAVELQANTGRWEYTTTSLAPTGNLMTVKVNATDRPGGLAVLAHGKSI